MYNGALANLRMSTDPFTMNRYAFANGNPIANVEIDGHYMAAPESGGSELSNEELFLYSDLAASSSNDSNVTESSSSGYGYEVDYYRFRDLVSKSSYSSGSPLVFGHIVEGTYNFFIGGSINTLTSDASSDEKAMAALSLVLSFKFLKFAKYGDELVEGINKTTYAREMGKLGERASGITKNTRRIESMTGKAKYRIPDGLDEINQTLIEVKNVKRQGYTSQLKDFRLWSKENGYDFILMTRSNTRISRPLQQLIDSGDIIHKYIQ